MKKLLLSAMILASVSCMISKAESIELVKVSSYNTGYMTGTYDEYPSRWIKMWNKIILNDTNPIQIDSHSDGDKYVYTMQPKQNLSICVYDKDKNEYCDYQNINVVKVDTGASDSWYPTKILLQYDGNKLPNVDINNIISWDSTTWAKYISFSNYGYVSPNNYSWSWYYSDTWNVVDVLWEKYLVTEKTKYFNDYNWIIKYNSDTYKINYQNSFYNTKYNGIWISSLTQWDLADFINWTTGVYITWKVSTTIDFANYFTSFKDPSIISSNNIKFDNTDKIWIKPQYNNPTSIATNSKTDSSASLNIDMVWYIWDANAYMTYIQKINLDPTFKTSTMNYVDVNGKKRSITKVISDNNNYDDYASGSTGAATQTVYYFGTTPVNSKSLLIVDLSKNLGTGSDDDLYKTLLPKVTVKTPIAFNLPKEMGINFVSPEKYNYFVSKQNDSYTAIDTSTTGSNVYIYKNAYTNVKAYIKGFEKDYKYVINSNNSPVYIRNTNYDNVHQFDILLPIKENDGADSTVSISAYTTSTLQTENLKNLIDKALFTNIKIVKTKKNTKDFENNVVNYFKNVKLNTTNTTVPVVAY